MSDNLNSVVIFTPAASKLDLLRQVFKKFNFNNIIAPTDKETCIKELQKNSDAILILDWAAGEADGSSILESVKGPCSIGIRPIMLISLEKDDKLEGVALEYGIMQLYFGEITGDKVLASIRALIKSQILSKDINEPLALSAQVKKDGDIEKCITILEELNDNHPGNEYITAELSENYFETGKLDEAEKLLKPMIDEQEERPLNSRLFNLYGRVLMKKGKFEEAADYLKQADLINPFNIDRLLRLGQVYLQIEKPKRAKKTFGRALKLNPDSQEAKQGMGQSLLQSGEINEALVFLKQLSGAEEMASVFNNAAIIAIKNGRYEDGMNLYKTAIETIGSKENTILSKLSFNIGLGHYKNNKIKDAYYYFCVSSKLDPNNNKATHSAKVTLKNLKDEKPLDINEDLFAALLSGPQTEEVKYSDNTDENGELSLAPENSDYDTDF